MATKNLSRTAIEGGRCGHYKSEVYSRIRQERAQGRQLLYALKHDPESWDDDCDPRRKPVTPCFADKLRPIYRFLDSKIGQDWDAVRSELFDKFDTRTTPGRHVLFDHLLRDVRESQEPLDRRYAHYAVTTQGKLAKIKSDRWSSGNNVTPFSRARKEDLVAIAAWLGHRKLGLSGNGFTWFVPTSKDVRVRAVYDRYDIVYARVDEAGVPLRATPLITPTLARYFDSRVKEAVLPAHVSFRQSYRLDAKDEAYFRAISPFWQKKLLEKAPA